MDKGESYEANPGKGRSGDLLLSAGTVSSGTGAYFSR